MRLGLAYQSRAKERRKKGGCGGQKGVGVTKHWQELRGHFFLLCELKKKKEEKEA